MGITGTNTYENKLTIKKFIFRIAKEQPDTEIVSLGNLQGADKYIKKYALESGLAYKEVNLPHTLHNLYSLMPQAFYDKPYAPKNFYVRTKIFGTYIDSCVLFDDSNLTNKATKHLKKFLDTTGKRVILVN